MGNISKSMEIDKIAYDKMLRRIEGRDRKFALSERVKRCNRKSVVNREVRSD